jgi:hypothetical protein
MTDGILGSGVHEKLTDEMIRTYLRRHLGAAAFAQALLGVSRKEDDSTIIVVDIGN